MDRDSVMLGLQGFCFFEFVYGYNNGLVFMRLTAQVRISKSSNRKTWYENE